VIVEGGVLPLDRANVDTDQIIPAHFLTGIETTGLGKHLFSGMTGGAELLAAYPAASILVTRENFGCGSSREHAAWSLAWTAAFARSSRRASRASSSRTPTTNGRSRPDTLLVRIDLDAGTLLTPGGAQMRFVLDPLRKEFLLSGGYMAFMAAKRDAVRAWLARSAQAQEETAFSAPM
jgi:3-isopropylmalate/(R)-2-methylmalate dehydratase small subunit